MQPGVVASPHRVESPAVTATVEAPTRARGEYAGPVDAGIIISIMGLLLSWPVVALVALAWFRKAISRLLRTLTKRIAKAPNLSLGNFYKDEGYRVAIAVGELLETKPETSPATSTTTTTPPPPLFETRRQAVVWAAASGAGKAFRRWYTAQQFVGRRFPDDTSALLTWVAEDGAPVVFRSYDVFSHLHRDICRDAPVPTESVFTNMVKTFERDHPGT